MNTGRPEAGAHYAALYTAAQTRIDELEAVLLQVADAFEGGPEHPWIPGFNAKPIYQPVMDAVRDLRSAQSGEPPQ